MPRIIAGEWRGRRIHAPAGREVRPTTDRIREAWMSSLHPALPGARVLDLFAGSGALGLECLSRGAAEVVFVEQSRPVVDTLRRNIGVLGAEPRCRVVTGDVFRELTRLPPAFDMALADPPYGEGLAVRLVEHFAQAPFAAELWLEHSRAEVLPALPIQRQRRYGDTLLSTFAAIHPPDVDDPASMRTPAEEPHS
ncbi:MAG: 16S rRNA (guanine(966)-N(2))-methyltransferase RsmD [Gemmatimonadales bacterium]|nr:MAG: 16S rRNA (guanine(966)-N(2))-methyltransferase RsmD [Gemmatimonadales bacterium]